MTSRSEMTKKGQCILCGRKGTYRLEHRLTLTRPWVRGTFLYCARDAKRIKRDPFHRRLVKA